MVLFNHNILDFQFNNNHRANRYGHRKSSSKLCRRGQSPFSPYPLSHGIKHGSSCATLPPKKYTLIVRSTPMYTYFRRRCGKRRRRSESRTLADAAVFQEHSSLALRHRNGDTSTVRTRLLDFDPLNYKQTK